MVSFDDCEGVDARAAKSPLAERGGGLVPNPGVGFTSLPHRGQPPSRYARGGNARDDDGEGSLSL